MASLKNVITINKHNIEDGSIKNMVKDLSALVDLRNQIQELKEKELELVKSITENYYYDIVVDGHFEFKLSKSKPKQVIDYDACIDDEDVNLYKKQYTSFRWDDKRIVENLGDKVVYKTINTEPKIEIKERKGE